MKPTCLPSYLPTNQPTLPKPYLVPSAHTWQVPHPAILNGRGILPYGGLSTRWKDETLWLLLAITRVIGRRERERETECARAEQRAPTRLYDIWHLLHWSGSGPDATGLGRARYVCSITRSLTIHVCVKSCQWRTLRYRINYTSFILIVNAAMHSNRKKYTTVILSVRCFWCYSHFHTSSILIFIFNKH